MKKVFLLISLLPLFFSGCTSELGEFKPESSKLETQKLESTSAPENSEPLNSEPVQSAPEVSDCGGRPCKTCNLPGGEKILSGATVKLYMKQDSGCATDCQAISKSATCSDGSLTGADPSVYQFAGCKTPTDCKACQLPCGGTTTGYGECFAQSAVKACGETCYPFRKRFFCANGILRNEDGSDLVDEKKYLYRTCSETSVCKSCQLPSGKVVPDGQKASFFKNRNRPCGTSCFSSDNQVTMTCSNGKFSNQQLYPEFIHADCSSSCSEGDKGAGRLVGDGGGAPNVVCPLPWGSGVATHQTQITAFSRVSASCGSSCNELKSTITCNGFRGLWSGGATFIYPRCRQMSCGGVGMQVNVVGGIAKIIAVTADGPAAQWGVKASDEIVQVKHKGVWTSATNVTVAQLKLLLQGDDKEILELKIKRYNSPTNSFEMQGSLTRSAVYLDSIQ